MVNKLITLTRNERSIIIDLNDWLPTKVIDCHVHCSPVKKVSRLSILRLPRQLTRSTTSHSHYTTA